jgi:prepilin-type N-terminal cleavage/methylation domain-containing protein
MNNTKGFSMLEVLIAMSVFLILVGGICYILLHIGKIAYYQYYSTMEQQKFADVIFVMNRDIRNCGYGINNISALAAFDSIEIKEGAIRCYMNHLGAISELVESVDLRYGKIEIMKVNGLKVGDLSLIAEARFEPHWTVIKINEIVEDSNYSRMVVLFNIVEQAMGSSKFESGAYFIPIEKVLYEYEEKTGTVVRVRNNGLNQPMIDDVNRLDFNYCMLNGVSMKNCIEVKLKINKMMKINEYKYVVEVNNLKWRRG